MATDPKQGEETMNGTFTHRVVYIDKETHEAKRCADCGAAPIIRWMNVSISSLVTGIERMFAAEFTCPNGPHEVSQSELKQTADLQAVADRAAHRIEVGFMSRWWRRG